MKQTSNNGKNAMNNKESHKQFANNRKAEANARRKINKK